MLIYGLLRVFGDQFFDRLHRLFLVAAVADDRQLDGFAGRRDRHHADDGLGVDQTGPEAQHDLRGISPPC